MGIGCLGMGILFFFLFLLEKRIFLFSCLVDSTLYDFDLDWLLA